MKIKLFSLMLALAMSTVMFAGNTPDTTGPADIIVTIDLNHTDVDEAALTSLFTDLEELTDEHLTCEVTFKLKVGFAGTGAEATVTVKGDCDKVIAEAKKLSSEVRALVGKKK